MVAVWVPTWLPLQVLELLPPVQHLAEIVLHDAHHTCDLVLNPAAKERGEKGDNEGRGEGTMYKYMKNARGWTQELVIHANDGAWPPDPNGYVHLPLHLGIYSVHPSNVWTCLRLSTTHRLILWSWPPLAEWCGVSGVLFTNLKSRWRYKYHTFLTSSYAVINHLSHAWSKHGMRWE